MHMGVDDFHLCLFPEVRQQSAKALLPKRFLTSRICTRVSPMLPPVSPNGSRSSAQCYSPDDILEYCIPFVKKNFFPYVFEAIVVGKEADFHRFSVEGGAALGHEEPCPRAHFYKPHLYALCGASCLLIRQDVRLD